MFKFLHAADIHLDSPLRGLERYEGAPVEEIRQATRRGLENLVELAVDQSVALVLIAGDLYDGDWREFRTGLFFVAQMARLREAGIPVLVIAGNHDAANKMTRRLPLPENVRMLSHKRPESVTLDELGVAIHGQSFARGAVEDNLAESYPAPVSGLFNVGLLHTAAEGREGHEPYAPCSVSDLHAKEYDYWALGHVHKRETLCDEPLIVFPGNVQGRHVRETGPKGCMLVTVDDGHRACAEFQPLDVVRWELCRIDAGELSTAYDVLDAVHRELENLASCADGRMLAVRVQIKGATPAHGPLAAEPHRWTNEVRALAHDVTSSDVWIEKVVLDTHPPRAAADSLPTEGPIGELIRYVHGLKSDPSSLARLAGELSDLTGKLPPEMTEGDGALRLDQPDRLLPLLEQAEQLLLHRLLSREGS